METAAAVGLDVVFKSNKSKGISRAPPNLESS